jgi:hypothetical protein
MLRLRNIVTASLSKADHGHGAMPKKRKSSVPVHLQLWIDARLAFGLSHAHVQMARELGLNPKKLGKLDNHDQEPWKLPLPDFITKLYRKRYGKDLPDTVRSIEEITAAKQERKLARKAAKTTQPLACGTAGSNADLPGPPTVS